MFNIKDGYKLDHKYLKLWNYLIVKKINGKNKKWKIVLGLEVVVLVLAQCNLIDYQYQQKSEVLHTFTPNKF